MLIQEKSRLQYKHPKTQPHTECLVLNATPVVISKLTTYINGDTIIQAFANHSLSLNVDIFPVFNRQHLHKLAVYVQWDSCWLNAEGNFVPAAIKKITDSCTSKDHSHSILGEPNGIVLQSFVFSIQSDRDLKTDRSNVSDTANETYSLLLATLCLPSQLTLQSQRWYRMRLEIQARSREHYLDMTLKWMGSSYLFLKARLGMAQVWAQLHDHPSKAFAHEHTPCHGFIPVPLWCLPGNSAWACLGSSTCPERLSKVLQTKLSLYWVLCNPSLLPSRLCYLDTITCSQPSHWAWINPSFPDKKAACWAVVLPTHYFRHFQMKTKTNNNDYALGSEET